MSGPQFIDELNFDEDISDAEMNGDGTLVAVVVSDLLGLYSIQVEQGLVVHEASYIIPTGKKVKNMFFSADSSVLSIVTSDGSRTDLSVHDRKRGFMLEVTKNRMSCAA